MLLAGARTLVCTLLVGSSLHWGARPSAARNAGETADDRPSKSAFAVRSGSDQGDRDDAAVAGRDGAPGHTAQVPRHHARLAGRTFSDDAARISAALGIDIPDEVLEAVGPHATFAEAPLKRVHRVTAYCDQGITAAGVKSGVGQCAAPADVPLGSLVVIPSLNRTFVVTDRTHQRFRHNTVDIFIPDRDDCLQFGLNYLDVEIYIPIAPPRYASPAFETLIRAFARG